MKVTGKLFPYFYLDPQAVRLYFFILVLLRRGSEKVSWVGIGELAKINPPRMSCETCMFLITLCEVLKLSWHVVVFCVLPRMRQVFAVLSSLTQTHYMKAVVVLHKSAVGSVTELHSLSCCIFCWRFGVMLILKQFVQMLMQIPEKCVV